MVPYVLEEEIQAEASKMGSTETSSKAPVVCVFCGTSAGNTDAHLEAARALAKVFHENGVNLVFGGGTTGLMGEVAKTLVNLSGPDAAHGIIPKALMAFERQYTNDEDSTAYGMEEQKKKDLAQFGRTTVVDDMHTRKQTMVNAVLSGGPGSGFVALSGGYGTLEELAEITTWNQLGIHEKPVVLFNVEGYWDGLLTWVKTAVKTGFVGEGNKSIMVEAHTAGQVLQRLRNYETAEGRLELEWASQTSRA